MWKFYCKIFLQLIVQLKSCQVDETVFSLSKVCVWLPEFLLKAALL